MSTLSRIWYQWAPIPSYTKSNLFFSTFSLVFKLYFSPVNFFPQTHQHTKGGLGLGFVLVLLIFNLDKIITSSSTVLWKHSAQSLCIRYSLEVTISYLSHWLELESAYPANERKYTMPRSKALQNLTDFLNSINPMEEVLVCTSKKYLFMHECLLSMCFHYNTCTICLI